MPHRKHSRIFIVALLGVHAMLLAWSDYQHSPVWDEPAHLAAGLSIWENGYFDLYTVNPPLVRAWAAVPVLLFGDYRGNEMTERQAADHARPGTRPEFNAGVRLIRVNGYRSRWLFTVARWACIPFSLLGGYVCWRWAGELYGQTAGCLAGVLWCFSPNVLAWSATICPDAAAASIGLAACYFFWRWMRKGTWGRATTAGVVLGLAELTKTTWLVLYVVWPVAWLICRILKPASLQHLRSSTSAAHLAYVLALSILVLNVGYAFEGTFSRLEQFTFLSRTLAGSDSLLDGGDGGNSFAKTWLGGVPLIWPAPYIQGIDQQKADFECGRRSFLLGRWKDRGWWHYYLICAALKIPLGTWILGGLAIVVPAVGAGRRLGRKLTHERSRQGAANHVDLSVLCDHLVLLLPAVTVFVLVSSQSGFGRHFRYTLPALPFAFVYIGGVAGTARRRPWTVGVLLLTAVIWSFASCMSVYPHCIAYFNALVGGPRNGHHYLLDSNFDWEQDVYYLKQWCDHHSSVTRLHTLLRTNYSYDLFGLACNTAVEPWTGNADVTGVREKERVPLILPGWYAVSVHRRSDPQDCASRFLRLKPVAMAGYSICIYHVTAADAAWLRRELGYPPLAVDSRGQANEAAK